MRPPYDCQRHPHRLGGALPRRGSPGPPLGLAYLGLVRRKISRTILVTLWSISICSFLCIWIVAFQTHTYEARYAYVGLAAIGGLAALGLERWKVPVRFLIPLAGLVGTVFAIQQDILSIHWT
jgi:hypothetical protein